MGEIKKYTVCVDFDGVTATPKLVAYLEDLINEEGYGSSVAEVAKTLVWRGIEELVKAQILDRRKGKFGGE